MKNKINKNTIPEGFTLGLVLVDALPVLFFGASAVVISILFNSGLFLAGALLCLIGGAGKVLWKLIVVLKRKNIWPLFIQMRVLMPAGFLLMIISLILNRGRLHFAAIIAGMLSFPSVLFFALGVIGMALMIVFSVRLDSSDLKSNWIEQFTNGIAQAAIFIGLLLLL